MHFTLAFSLGLALGAANWLFWRKSVEWFLKAKGPKSWLIGLSTVKLGLLAVLIWVLLKKCSIDPIGFLLGFSATVLWTLVRGFKWKA